MKSLKLALLLILILLSATFDIKANSLDNSDCSDFEFIFARGSGQTLNDSDYKSYKSAIEEKLKDEKISFYELGEKTNGYPAISADFMVSLGAIVSAGESYKFGESVEKGTSELIERVKEESKRCKNKKFILSGYSQGAVVIDKSLNLLNSEKIFYVANFGDPKLYLPEGKRACKKLNLSSYRIYVPDCNVEEGILDGQKPYQPASFYNKLGVWCNKNDIICGSSLNILNPMKAHVSYNLKDGYEKFAELILEKITNKSTELKPTDARYSDSKKRNIVVIYDFSEMSSYEFQNKGKSINDKLKSRLVELANHGTRIAVYNSYSLQIPAKSLEKKIDFTNDNLSEKIDRYNYENRLFVGYIFGSHNNNYKSIKEVIKTAAWSDGSEKHIFLLSNFIYDNNISVDGTSRLDVISLAKRENVKISVISTDGFERQYEEIIEETGGTSIGDNYSKIFLNKNRSKKFFSKTFEINLDSKYTLVVINGAVYGLSDKKSITITSLDSSRKNIVSFIGYDESGKKVNIKSFNFHPGKIKAPDAGVL